ncbi:sugar 3,4-ketoisomerase [Sporosarcina siberiensis]|uniref:Sugar 3,4-ketoisomerase n=1 Tax=Sporosarcina siberiensis TaxID=1365606 RepID=A0ABW4SDR5_9BACL
MGKELMETTLRGSELLKLEEFGDERGSLIALEALKNVPFDIKRVFYIYNTNPDSPRGFHAMIDSYQVMVCVNGSVDVVLDNGTERQTFPLSSIHQGLFVDKMIWHEMHNFSEDCILMVLTNNPYTEEDNLIGYENYLEMIK